MVENRKDRKQKRSNKSLKLQFSIRSLLKIVYYISLGHSISDKVLWLRGKVREIKGKRSRVRFLAGQNCIKLEHIYTYIYIYIYINIYNS